MGAGVSVAEGLGFWINSLKHHGPGLPLPAITSAHCACIRLGKLVCDALQSRPACRALEKC